MTYTHRALMVFADPALHRSRISRRVGDAVRSLPGVQVQDLYELYPDFFIDARNERSLLKQSELLIFGFQLAWYSMPSLLKEWIDAVFKPEWADGAGPLRGKSCWVAVACNSMEADYRPGGRHGRPLSDYLAPLEQVARACGMHWLEPHVYYGADRADAQAIDAHAAELRELMAAHIARLPAPPAIEGGGHGA